VTILLRRIAEAKSWRALERTPITDGHVPNWVLREFLPTPRDQNIISVYEVAENDKQALDRLASALLVSWNADHFLFVGARRSDLESSGIIVSDDTGGTFDQQVNAWHRGLKIENVEQAQTVSRHFLTGKMAFRYSRKESLEAASHHASSGNIDLMRAWKKSETRMVVIQLIDANAATVVPHQRVQQ